MKLFLVFFCVAACFALPPTFTTPAKNPQAQGQVAGAGEDITTGLVQHWTANEGSGTTLGNSVGGGADGTLNAFVGWVAGHISGAVDFSGAARVDFAETVLPLGAKTIALWVKSPNGGGGVLLDNAAGTTSNHGTYIARTTGNKIDFFSAHGGGVDVRFYITSATSIGNDVWTHVAVTWDGTTGSGAAKIYINGAVDNNTGTAADTETTAASVNLNMGQNAADSGAEQFAGLLDDIRVYSRALTPSQIATLAAQ